jgi:hypothetical protein
MNVESQDFNTKEIDDSAAMALLRKSYALLGELLDSDNEDVIACAVEARSAIHIAASHIVATNNEDAELQLDAIRYRSIDAFEFADRNAAAEASKDVDRLCDRLDEYMSQKPKDAA